MQSSSYFTSESPPNKVKNILIRHSCSKKVKFASSHQPQEGSYLLKYAPKYYQSLTIQLKPQNALISKVKKIKKLKTFTGLYKNEIFQKLWLNLLASTRKDIEETLQIEPNRSSIMISKAFWIKTNTQKMKYFPNVTRLARPRWAVFDYVIGYFNNTMSKKGYFAMYLENMRRLKSIKMVIKDGNFDEAKWLLGKLDRMRRLLSQLETFSMEVRLSNQNSIYELLKYKNVCSHVTGFSFPQAFQPALVEIPFQCRMLKTLSINLEKSKENKLIVSTLLSSIQQLPHLKSLSFSGPEDAKLFWDNFRPQSSLRYLSLKFSASDLFKSANKKDAVGDWEGIKELEVLELTVLSSQAKEIMFVRFLITKILQKISKLGLLRINMEASVSNLSFQAYCEPFLAEEVPHLYDSLERFEFRLMNSSKENDSVKIDMKMTKLRLFKNLKEVKIDGNGVCFENMDKIVDLLQENQKQKGDFRLLEFNIEKKEALKEVLQKIQRAKGADRNFKIYIHLIHKDNRYSFGLPARFTSLELNTLEDLCKDIQTVGPIPGLAICLDLYNKDYFGALPAEDMKLILRKYAGIRNFTARLHFLTGSVEYINTDGEKTQFLVVDLFWRE